MGNGGCGKPIVVPLMFLPVRCSRLGPSMGCSPWQADKPSRKNYSIVASPEVTVPFRKYLSAPAWAAMWTVLSTACREISSLATGTPSTSALSVTLFFYKILSHTVIFSLPCMFCFILNKNTQEERNLMSSRKCHHLRCWTQPMGLLGPTGTGCIQNRAAPVSSHRGHSCSATHPYPPAETCPWKHNRNVHK